MPHLDYISCMLTIASTLLIGRRMWQGWVVAAVNSAIICIIGLQTAQLGFLPANIFCVAIYAFNIMSWRSPAQAGHSPRPSLSDTLSLGAQAAATPVLPVSPVLSVSPVLRKPPRAFRSISTSNDRNDHRPRRHRVCRRTLPR